MHLKKSKEEIAASAYRAAMSAMLHHKGVSGFGMNYGNSSITDMLTDLIAKAIEAGVSDVLQNIYTNEEFEKDVGLK
jgi:hypothetical protein